MYKQLFELHTDIHYSRTCSSVPLPGRQGQGNKKRVVCSASMRRSLSEDNYTAYKLKFIVLTWVITEKIQDYLHGHIFCNVDWQQLCELYEMAWLAELSSYDRHLVPIRTETKIDALSSAYSGMNPAIAEPQWLRWKGVCKSDMRLSARTSLCRVPGMLCHKAQNVIFKIFIWFMDVNNNKQQQFCNHNNRFPWKSSLK